MTPLALGPAHILGQLQREEASLSSPSQLKMTVFWNPEASPLIVCLTLLVGNSLFLTSLFRGGLVSWI